MERIVICDECGFINDYDDAVVKDRSGVIKLFKCGNCGSLFFKMERQVEADDRKVRAENNSRLGKKIRETEKLIENLGEEDKSIKILASLLVEIGRKNFRK